MVSNGTKWYHQMDRIEPRSQLFQDHQKTTTNTFYVTSVHELRVQCQSSYILESLLQWNCFILIPFNEMATPNIPRKKSFDKIAFLSSDFGANLNPKANPQCSHSSMFTIFTNVHNVHKSSMFTLPHRANFSFAAVAGIGNIFKPNTGLTWVLIIKH